VQQAKQNASKPLVEIDLKSANDPSSSALVAKGDKTGKASGAGAASKPKKPNTATSLTAMKAEWAEREREVKAELTQRKATAKEVEIDLLATYLERVEDRDKAREDDEKADKARKLAEYQALLDAERTIREEEEAAAKARHEQAELRKKLDKGSVEKKLDKFTKAREAARKKKLAGDATASLVSTKSCTDLVDLDCKTGNCKLLTASALSSAQCVRAELEKAANVTQAAGLSETEAAKKIVALLFEIRVGLETGEKALKVAEAAMAKIGGQEGAAVEQTVKVALEALGRAHVAFESTGVSGKDGLASVHTLEVKAKEALAEVMRKVEAEREKHRAEGAAAVVKARTNVEAASFVEARAAHGNALVEYEMADMKDTMGKELADLLVEIARAEEVAKVKDAAAAVLKRKELEAAEQKVAAEKEKLRLEEEAKKVEDEAQRLVLLAKNEKLEEAAELVKAEQEKNQKALLEKNALAAEARRQTEQVRNSTHVSAQHIHCNTLQHTVTRIHMYTYTYIFIYMYIMSHMNESCHVSMSHVT